MDDGSGKMTSRDYPTLVVTTPKPHVLLVTLNRPEAANAFNTQMAKDLLEVFEALALDPGETRAVVLTGAGTRAFCAGADLKERNGMSDEAWGRQHLLFERMIRAILNCPLPLIGAVNGAAYGGGCEIAAAVDFLYAAETARFAQTETKLGIVPGIGGTQNLARAVGERRAKELILTGKPFSAAEALDWGLANAVFPQDRLLDEALATAAAIAANAPIAVRQAKRAIHRGLQMSLAEGLCFEIEAYNRTIPTEDRQEGILAFNEKRQPRFRGR
jgi:enoyl-CoA hydratase/carnithine racemase